MMRHAITLRRRLARGKLILVLAGLACGMAGAAERDELLDACRRSDLEAVRTALPALGRDIHAPVGEPRQTPLHAAVHGRPSQPEARRAIVAALLAHGADVQAVAAAGESVLAAATQAGWDEALLDLLLAHGAKIDHAALGQAAARGDAPLVRFLLSRGADPNAADPRTGHTALMRVFREPESPHRWHPFAAEACRLSAFACMQALLAGGAEVERANERGETALHAAAGANHLQCLRELLSRGARADSRAASGETALHFAASNPQHHDRAVLDTLLAASKLSVDIADRAGRTPLHAAVGSAGNSAVQSLLLLGADTTRRDAKGRRPADMDAATLLDRGTREMLRRYTPAPDPPAIPEPAEPAPARPAAPTIKV